MTNAVCVYLHYTRIRLYRNLIKQYLLLFQRGTVSRLRARTNKDDITFDAGRVISFSPKVKNIVKEED